MSLELLVVILLLLWAVGVFAVPVGNIAHLLLLFVLIVLLIRYSRGERL